jgi:diamine N-acetyltransferase
MEPGAEDERRFASFPTWAAATEAREEADRPAAIRSVAAGAVVTLDEITQETVRVVCRLMVAPEQAKLVAPNAVSIAQAYFSPNAWFRAIAADGVPVGFVMLYEEPDKPEYTLWRFMIDAREQGKGFGRAAIGLVLDHVRTLPGATELRTSWFDAPGGPAPFYVGLGFVPTGEVDEGEVGGRIEL